MIFLSQFWQLLNQASFLEAAGAVVEIGFSSKPNHHNQVLLVQIRETLVLFECVLRSTAWPEKKQALKQQ